MPIMAALLEVDELRFEIDDDVCAAKDVWGVEVWAAEVELWVDSLAETVGMDLEVTTYLG